MAASVRPPSVLDVRPAWFVEFDKAPSKVLAHHWPTSPTTATSDRRLVHGSACDIITGGSPRQDLEPRGQTRWHDRGHPPNLWVRCARQSMSSESDHRRRRTSAAPSQPQPIARLPCPGCGRWGRRACSATRRVLGTRPTSEPAAGISRAADVGAAHGRFRVFPLAVPADADPVPKVRREPTDRTSRTPVAGVGGSAADPAPRDGTGRRQPAWIVRRPDRLPLRCGTRRSSSPTPAECHRAGKTVDEGTPDRPLQGPRQRQRPR